ncbi:alpha beta-hydrolase [Diplodia corticola]|uniref:Kynurenine formamidase n=1 Tax=Diplodia corticola TaxID=236234 RepID=A0A1J9SFZ3_9PEZI|nr:alpha beta-hydrolase [Diplodia corticola]OJD38732.1 alpha beta-hydrolase [Diplodia corticola]
MVDVYDVRRRCAQAAALADAATQALPRPQQQQQQQFQQQFQQQQRLHRSTSAPQQYQVHPSPLLQAQQQPAPQRSPPQPQGQHQQYSYQQHQQHRANLLRSNSINNGSSASLNNLSSSPNTHNNMATNPATAYVNGAFSTPLRADNTFLKMNNATQSYPLHIKGVPYATTSRLQTLDICLPRPLSESPKDAVWVVYIHGGAWRDPLVSSSSLTPAVHHLLSPTPIPATTSPSAISSPAGSNRNSTSSSNGGHSTTGAGGHHHSSSTSSNAGGGGNSTTTNSPKRALSHIAGFASINYRLSPYPQHPTAPSLSPTSSIPARHEGRNVTHPSHVSDAAAALRWLRSEYGVGGESGPDGPPARDWVAVGHSCGATLACQLVADGWLDGSEFDKVAAPVGVAALCGLYNLPLLAENHADCPAYEEFLQAAFGGDESVWLRASPTALAAKLGEDRWRKGRCVVLAASPDDELVEPMQRDVMVRAMEEGGWVRREEGGGPDGRELVLLDVEGRHDDAWREGRGVARAIEVLVGRLFGAAGRKEGEFF